MRLDHLKGLDKIRATALIKVAQKADLHVYLASLEKSVWGGCDDDDDCDQSGYHEIIDVCDESTKLKRVCDMSGHERARDVAIDDDQLIQEDALDEVDEEDYSGWTGNEGR